MSNMLFYMFILFIVHICILLYIHITVLYYILASFQKTNVIENREDEANKSHENFFVSKHTLHKEMKSLIKDLIIF